jgi:phage FluMu protein Com
MSLTMFIDDTCPRCRKPVKLSVIEPHPSQRDQAIHNYHCVDCGPVLAKIISLKATTNGNSSTKASQSA